MKKNNLGLDFFKISKIKYKSPNIENKKTTDINILLNRVKINKEIEFKKKITLSILLLLFISFFALFYFFQ